MKKFITTMLAMSSCLVLCQAQNISQSCTYTAGNNTDVYDVAGRYAAVASEHTTIQLVSIDNSCNGTIIFQQNLNDTIKQAYINVKGDSLVAAILTKNALHLKSFHISGTTATSINAGQHTLQDMSQFIRISKASYGLGIIERYYVGSTETATGSFIRYNGQNAHSLTLSHTACACYAGIVSDNQYHYLFYTEPDGVWVERRHNDANMSYEGLYPMNSVMSPAITDIQQTDTTITFVTVNGNNELVRQRYDKGSSMGLTHYATITHPVGSLIDGDMGRFVDYGLMAYGSKIIKHSDDPQIPSGNLTVQTSLSFDAGHANFMSSRFGGGHYIWSGLGNNGIGPVTVWYLQDINKISSISINDGATMMRRGQHRISDTTFVLFGQNASDKKGKAWFIGMHQIPNSIIEKPKATEIAIYPNPAGRHITVSMPGQIQRIAILDITGYPVKVFAGNNTGEQTVSLSYLAAGNYLLDIQTIDGQRTMRKISKL